MVFVPTIVCRARDLSATLAESIRVDLHRQLDTLIAAYQDPIPYALTERLADDAESRFSAELDTRESR